MVDNTIGIIGTGYMGAAIVKTLHNNKIVDEKNIIIYDKDISITKEISNQFIWMPEFSGAYNIIVIP